MPNYVKHVVKIIACDERKQQVLDFIRGKEPESVIDFNKIVPMPSVLKGIVEDVKVDFARRCYENKELNISNDKELQDFLDSIECKWPLDEIRKLVRVKEDYGSYSWYDWSIKFWGTKWNAWDSEIDDNGDLVFYTAWSSPGNVLVVLSKIFPDVFFEVTYADEDTGYNAGEGRYIDGCEDMYRPEGGSVKAYEIAFRVWEREKDNYELVDGEYKPID